MGRGGDGGDGDMQMRERAVVVGKLRWLGSQFLPSQPPGPVRLPLHGTGTTSCSRSPTTPKTPKTTNTTHVSALAVIVNARPTRNCPAASHPHGTAQHGPPPTLRLRRRRAVQHPCRAKEQDPRCWCRCDRGCCSRQDACEGIALHDRRGTGGCVAQRAGKRAEREQGD